MLEKNLVDIFLKLIFKAKQQWRDTSARLRQVLYHFIQFEQHVTFLFFRQISKIAINREKIIGGVNENWV